MERNNQVHSVRQLVPYDVDNRINYRNRAPINNIAHNGFGGVLGQPAFGNHQIGYILNAIKTAVYHNKFAQTKNVRDLETELGRTNAAPMLKNCVHSFLWTALNLRDASIEEKAAAFTETLDRIFCLEAEMSGGSLYAAVTFLLKHRKLVDPLFFIRLCFFSGRYTLTLTGDRLSKYGESTWVVYQDHIFETTWEKWSGFIGSKQLAW